MSEAQRRTRRRPTTETKRALPRPDCGKSKSVEDLAREQGIKPITRLEDVLGKGKGLWKSDEEFEQFLADIYEQRRRDREA